MRSRPEVLFLCFGEASVNWIKTLITSSFLRRALAGFSGCSLLVISLSNHKRPALASASPALYQWRLLALTLPTTTLFLRTTSAAPPQKAEYHQKYPSKAKIPPTTLGRSWTKFVADSSKLPGLNGVVGFSWICLDKNMAS